MQNAIVEVVCVGSGSNKTYNSIYTDPGSCKMVIVQDDDKFPSPRLCLLRKWPNFENGLSFGFDLYEDLLNSTGFLKIEEVTRNSPAEAGGLRKNDVIIEINGDNVEYKSFFRLIEICKDAFSRNEMELLVLAEQDAEWYRIRNICVNSNFPNIEYCETPFYGYIFKPLDCYQVPSGAAAAGQKVATSQIEFHSSSGKLFRTTLVIDKNKDSIYKRVEELPSGTPEILAPLRPDGSYRHPGTDNTLRVYYRPERGHLARTASTGALQQGTTSDENFHTAVDSGLSTMTTNRRSTPLSTGNLASMSPYSTIDKGTIKNVDLLHDKWGDLMDKYLDEKYRSTQSPQTLPPNEGQQASDNKDSISKKGYAIPLNDPKGSKRSRATSPNDTFSYLYSGRDYQTASAGSFGPSSNRKPSPFNYLAQRGTGQTQSQRYPSPNQSVRSPTRTNQRHPSQPRPPPQQVEIVSGSSSFQHYDTIASTTTTTRRYHQLQIHGGSRETSPTQPYPGEHISKYNSTGTGSSRYKSQSPYSVIFRQQQQQQEQQEQQDALRGDVSQALGFLLDEKAIITNGLYVVKYVDPNSASSLAGLKVGDRITKINGKLTNDMSYEQFCEEIIIAQQQQQHNNMIHLMVMRKSAKSTASSYTGTGSSVTGRSGSNNFNNMHSQQTKIDYSTPTSPSSATHVSSGVVGSGSASGGGASSSILTTSTSSNLNMNEKTNSSSFVDEGYVQSLSSTNAATASSASSGGAILAANSTSSSSSNLPYNLVSVIKVTSPASANESGSNFDQAPQQQYLPKDTVRPVNTHSYDSVTTPKPTIIYDSENPHGTAANRPNVAAEVSQQNPSDSTVEMVKYETIEDDYGSNYTNPYLSDPSEPLETYPSDPAPELPRTPPPSSSTLTKQKPLTVQRDIDREIELQQQREKEYFDQREQREKEQREREMQKVQQQPELKPLIAGIASALAYGSAQQQQQQPASAQARPALHGYEASIGIEKTPEPLRHQLVEETTTTTTTYIKEKYNEEFIQEHSDGAGKLRESLETEIISSSTYLPEDADLDHYVERGSINDPDRQGNYAQKYQYKYGESESASAKNDFSASYKYKFEGRQPQTTHLLDRNPVHMTDAYSHDEVSSATAVGADNTSNNIQSLAEMSEVYDERYAYVERTYTFKKQLSPELLEKKQFSLAQVLNQFNLDKQNASMAAGNFSYESTMDFSESEVESSNVPPPYVLGLLLKPKQNPLEIGNHVISHIEPQGLADIAGMRPNSRIIRLNDITCEDKTHEFILFFLNYLLRKNSCDTIEITVNEPQSLSSSEHDSHRYNQPTYTKDQHTVHFQESTHQTDYNKYNQYHQTNSSHVDSGISSSVANPVLVNPNAAHSVPSSENIRNIIKEIIEVAKHKVVQVPQNTTTSRPATTATITSAQSTHSATYLSSPIGDQASSSIHVSARPATTTASVSHPQAVFSSTYTSVPCEKDPTYTSYATTPARPLAGSVAPAQPAHSSTYLHSPAAIDPTSSSTEHTFVPARPANNESPRETVNNISASTTSLKSNNLKSIIQEILQTPDRTHYQQPQPRPVEAATITARPATGIVSSAPIIYQNDRDHEGIWVQQTTETPTSAKVTHRADESSASYSHSASSVSHLRAITLEAIQANQRVSHEPTRVDSMRSTTTSSNQLSYTTATESRDPSSLAHLKVIAQQAILAEQRESTDYRQSSPLTSSHQSTSQYTASDSSSLAHLKAIAQQAILAEQRYGESTDYGQTLSHVTSSHQSTNQYTASDSAALANLKAIAQQAILANQRYEEPSKSPSPATVQYVSDDPEMIAHLKAIAQQALLSSNKDEFFKQQNVMESLVSAMNTNEELLGRLKSYDVYKRDNFFGYGIAFHTESTPPSKPSHKLVYPFIEVEPDTPAEEAGLKYGQRVVAVNGAFVNRELKTLDDVVQAIEDSYYNRSFTTITVLDPVMWQDFMANPNLAAELTRPQSRPSSQKIEIPEPSGPTTKHICQLVKTKDSYGFDFKTLKNEFKHVANNVKPGYPADLAGLRNGDHILEVNGKSIEGVEHENVVRMIASDANRVELLVERSKQEQLAPVQQQPPQQPPQVVRPPSPIPTYDGLLRLDVHTRPDYQGFGITLSQNSNGIISKVEPNSPAADAGLEVNHQIVEVNRTNVRGKSNKEIREIIGQNKDNLVLGVVKVSQPATPSSSRDQSKIDARPAIQQLVDEQIPTNQPRPAKSETNLSIKGGSKLGSSSSSKMSASHNNLSRIKNTFGSCLGLNDQDEVDKALHEKAKLKAKIDGLKDARVCDLVRRDDFTGYGFSIHKNPKGPHQITNVEPNSPAFESGLKNDDLLLRVNDVDVVGENYTKTILKIKNESDKGRLKLTVIDPSKCPSDIKNKSLEASTTTPKTKPKTAKATGSTSNLRDITREMINSPADSTYGGSVSQRPVSVDRQSTSTDVSSVDPKKRSQSSVDLRPAVVQQPPNRTTSVANVNQPSTATITRPADQRPRLKVCTIEKTPTERFGFGLNPEKGTRHTIYSVDPDSPAEHANVKPGDIILRINKQYVRNKNFDKIKELVKKASTQTQKIELLLIDLDGFKYWKKKQKKFKKLDSFIIKDDLDFYSNRARSQGPASPARVEAVSPLNRLPPQTQPSDDESSTRRSYSAIDTTKDKSFREPSPSTSASTPATNRRPVVDNNDINRVINKLTIYRRPTEKLGMNLSDSKPSDYDGEGMACPFVNSVTPGSAAEEAGLQKGDIVIEVNGVSTAGKKAASLAPLMKGDVNEITIARERDAPAVVNEKPIQQPAQNVIVTQPTAPSTSATYEPNTSHISRTSSIASRSTQNELKVSQYEEKMNSSKLHTTTESQQQPGTPSTRPRNQSEPAPVDRVNVTQTNQGNTGVTSSPQLSRRSASSFYLPPDAPIPRLCRVKAYEPNLGFIVLGSKQHEGTYKINEIVPNSPAAHSGLQNQDIIIEVTGVNVLNMKYDEVVGLIKAKKQENDLQLLVVDKPTLEWYKSKKIPISSQIVPKMQYIETLLRDELDELDRQQNGHLSAYSSTHLHSPDEGSSQHYTTHSPQPYSTSQTNVNINNEYPTSSYTRDTNRPGQSSQPPYVQSEFAPRRP